MITALFFARPEALWLLLLVPLVALWSIRSRAAAGTRRRAATGILQALALVLAVAAFAAPWSNGPGQRPTRIAVVVPGDVAVTAAVRHWRAATAYGDPFYTVAAGGHPVVGPRGSTAVPAADDRAPRIVSALVAAIGLVPEGTPGEIALLGVARDGSGLGSDDEIAALLAPASRRGIRVHWRRAPGVEPGPCVVSVQHRAAAQEREAIAMTAELAADRDCDGVLTVALPSGEELVRQPVRLAAGASTHHLAVTPPTGDGVVVLQTQLTVDGRSDPDTMRERTALRIAGRPRVLYLGGNHAALRDTLDAQGFATFVGDPGADWSAALAECDAVVIDDLPATAWSETAQRALAASVVGNGTGLLLAGARANLGPGGYADSPLAPLLPVEMPQREERRDPSVALVLIIDTSGSMGGNRVELAKEVARLAVRRLLPHDKVGIVEFYGSKRWAAPMQPAANAIELNRALNRLQAGGGTIIYSALEEAYYALLNVRTRFKHILVLTDGGVEAGPFEALARQMADGGMNLSTVLIGPQGNSPFLMNLAQWGRGRFYACPSRFQLPDLRFKEPQTTLLPAVQERPFSLKPVGSAEATGSLRDDGALRVGGAVDARLRPEAELLLAATGDLPLLAAWDRGHGRVMVWTSQLLGPMALPARRSPTYGTFLADAMRSLVRPRQALRERLDVRAGRDRLRVELTAPERARWPLPALRWRQGATAGQCALVPSAAGAFAATLPWPGLGDDPVELEVDANGQTLRAAAVRPLPTQRRTRSVRAAITELVRGSGGTFGDPDGALPDSTPLHGTADAPRPLAPALALWALLTFLAALLVRRWPATTRVAGGAALLVAAFVLPALPAQEPEQRIQQELRARGDLDALADEWRDGTLEQRIALARARGDLTEVATLMAEGGEKFLERRALFLEASGETRAALVAIRSILAKPLPETTRGQWRQREGELLLALRRPDEAEPALREAAQLYREPAARRALGHLAGGYGRYDLALELYRVDELSGKAALHAHLRRAVWQQLAGRIDEAVAEYRLAYAHARLRRDRAFVLVRQTAVMRGARRLEELADQWLERHRSATAGADNSELDGEERAALLAALRELGRGDEALALLEDIDDPKLQEQALAIAVESGAQERAIAMARQQLQKEPENARLRIALALLLTDARETGDAERTLIDGYPLVKRKELLWLVQAASELALQDALRPGLEVLASSDDERNRLQAVLLEYRHLSGRKQEQQAVQVLLAARGKFARPAHRARVAEALESAGRTQEAIALFAEIFREEPTEDLGLRLAWLLTRSSDKADRTEAERIFREVWLTAGSRARRVQAEERVLDLAAREGTLADLAIELEDALEDPATEHRAAKREALVKIYSRAKDTITAAQILEQFGREPGRQVEAYTELARVYMENEEFRNVERTLRRLMQLDPEGELDYRQQLAMSALERGRPAEARAVIREMLGGDRAGAVAFEFAAGIYSLAGRFAEAAQVYRRSLAQNPERIETLLLWANTMTRMDQGHLALGTFCDLLLQDVRDDLFMVAVDGLLNLGAPPEQLRFAERAVRRRLAATPEKVYLHRVLQDVLESLGDDERRLQSLVETVLVAGEQRTTWLRELMEEASTRRDWAAYVEHGRALLLSGEELPPAVFLDLGEALLQQDSYREAERAFARARLAPDFARVERRVAELYEKAGRLEDAERVRRRILRRDPENPDALFAVARLVEQRGDAPAAAILYRQCAGLLFEGADLADDGMQRGPVRVGRQRPKTSDASWEEALDGLLRCAAGPDGLHAVRDQILARLVRQPPPAAAGWLDALGRLRRIASAWDDDVTMGKLQALEDRLLVEHRDEESVRNDIFAARLARGDLDGAATAAGVLAEQYSAERLQLLLLRGETAAARALAERAGGRDRGQAIRLLWLAGDADGAASLLPELERAARANAAALGSVWIDSCRLLGRSTDDRFVRDARLQKALSESSGDPRRRVNAVVYALRVHGELSTEDKVSHLRAILDQVLASDDGNTAQSYLTAAAGLLPDAELAPVVALAFAKVDRAYMIPGRARFLALLPTERARTLLDGTLRRFSSDERRSQTLRLLNDGQLPAELQLSLLDVPLLDKLAPADEHWLSRLCLQVDLPPAVGDALLAQMRRHQSRQARTHLLAARLQPDAERRRGSLVRAVQVLGSKATLDYRDLQVIERIAELADEVAQLELFALEDTPAAQVVHAELWRRSGDMDRAVEALTAIYRRNPDDTLQLNRLQALLEQTGRTRLALEVYRTYVDHATRVYPYQAGQLARLHLRLGEGEAALAALAKADDDRGSNLSLRLEAAAHCEDVEFRTRAARAWLQDQQRLRSRGTRVVVVSRPRTGQRHSLADARAPLTVRPLFPAREDMAKAPTDLDLLGFLPEGAELARVLRRGMVPAARDDNPGLYRGWLAGARLRGEADALLESARQRLNAAPYDAEALRLLLGAAQVGLPAADAELTCAVERRLLAPNPPPELLVELALTAHQQGREDLARRILRALAGRRADLTRFQVRERVPDILALFAQLDPGGLLALLPSMTTPNEHLDGYLMIALAGHPERDAVLAAYAILPEHLRSRSPFRGAMSLALPYAGLSLRAGNATAALDVLAVDDPGLENEDGFPAQALLAAVPPLSTWQDAADVEVVREHIVAQLGTGPAGRRLLFLRLGCALALRLVEADRVEEAVAMRTELQRLGGALPGAADWLAAVR